MEIFSTFISVFIIGLLMQYFVLTSLRNPEMRGSIMVLKPDKAYGLVGLFGLAIAFAISMVPFTPIAGRSTGIEFIPVIALSFAALGIYLFVWEARHSVEVSDDRIVSNSFWRKSRVISWDEIEKVDFGKVSLYLKLSNKVTIIRVHMHLPGFKKFLSTMREKLNSNLYSNALAKVNKAYKQYNVDLSSGF